MANISDQCQSTRAKFSLYSGLCTISHHNLSQIPTYLNELRICYGNSSWRKNLQKQKNISIIFRICFYCQSIYLLYEGALLIDSSQIILRLCHALHIATLQVRAYNWKGYVPNCTYSSWIRSQLVFYNSANAITNSVPVFAPKHRTWFDTVFCHLIFVWTLYILIVDGCIIL